MRATIAMNEKNFIFILWLVSSLWVTIEKFKKEI